MPLEVGGMEFDYLSGPVGMCIFTPSNALISQLSKGKGYNVIPILGFEDLHWSLKNNCYELNMCKENDVRCVTLYTPILYRLLDQLATSQYSIHLFMEIGFFPYLLKNDKLISPERLSVFNATDGSMTYIARRHAACLATSRNTENELCFTSNLKYHLSDMRYEPSHLSLRDEEKELISVANKLVRESPYMTVPLQDLYSEAEQMISRKDAYVQNVDLKLTHFPTFESYMLDSFSTCCRQSHVLFYGEKAHELLMLAVTDANAFVNRLTQFRQWFPRSLFAMRMSSSIFPFDFLIKMWKQYIHYAFHQDKQREYYLDLVKNLDDSVFDTYNLPKFRALRVRGSRDRYRIEHRVPIETEEFIIARAKANNLEDVRTHFSDILDDAMMEFYFLLTSWKTEHNNSLLSIFSAGSKHITNVRFFMQQHGYYNTMCLKASNIEFSCVQLSSQRESQNKETISLSKWLMTYWKKMNPKKQYSLYQRLALQQRRIKLLGTDIMYKILNGNAVSSDVIDDKIKDIQNIHTLDLTTITVPSQYANKRLTL